MGFEVDLREPLESVESCWNWARQWRFVEITLGTVGNAWSKGWWDDVCVPCSSTETYVQKTRQERLYSWWNTIVIIVGFIWAHLRLCGEDGCFVLVLGERLSVSIREERDRFMVACLWSGGGCCYFFANMIMGDWRESVAPVWGGKDGVCGSVAR